MPMIIAPANTTPLLPPKLKDAIAGPGHRPANPQAVVRIRGYPITSNKPKVFFAIGVSLRACDLLSRGHKTGAGNLNIARAINS